MIDLFLQTICEVNPDGTVSGRYVEKNWSKISRQFALESDRYSRFQCEVLTEKGNRESAQLFLNAGQKEIRAPRLTTYPREAGRKFRIDRILFSGRKGNVNLVFGLQGAPGFVAKERFTPVSLTAAGCSLRRGIRRRRTDSR